MNRRLTTGALLAMACTGLLAISASAQIVFDGNILFGNGAAATEAAQYNQTLLTNACAGLSPSATTQQVAAQFGQNTYIDPLLNAAYANFLAPNYTLQAGSPAYGPNAGHDLVDANLVDAWLNPTCWAGAVDQSNDWTQGWTYHNFDGGLGRTDIPAGTPVFVTTNITTNTTWTSNNNYLLFGRIAVQAGAILTIEPGVVVTGSGEDSYLVIERGAQIFANGTAQQPIIMTSGAPLGDMLPGDWGGLVVMGRAVANCAGGSATNCVLTSSGSDCISEGGAGNFGGSDDSDDSGTLRYVRVEYSGVEIAPNNELNCFTFNGVGDQTEVEYLQAFGGKDDLFEWFGGTARARYLYGLCGEDDGLDWQMGWRGKVQFAIIHYVDTTDGGLNSDSGIEADNNEFDFDCALRSNPVLANLTLIGDLQSGRGIHLRRGTYGTILNSIVVGFPTVGFQIENTQGLDGCLGANPAPFCTQPTAANPLYAFRVDFGPNPVIGQSNFAFSLAKATSVKVNVYNAAGRLIETVFDGVLSEGPQMIPWLPREASSGVYYYNVVAGASTAQGKLMVVN